MARDFDGTADYLEASSAVFTGPPYTISAWINADELKDQVFVFVGDNAVVDQEFFLFGLASGGVRHRVQAGGPSAAAVATSNYSTGTWHHIAARSSASNSRDVYIDGGSKGTSTATISPTGVNTTSIARQGDSTGSSFVNGRMAHVAIWDVALTDEEIATLAQGVSPLRVRRDALVAYWPVGGQSPEVDVVGGVNMAVNGTPVVSEEPPIPWAVVAPG